MATGRDDFVIAIRSAFLKKKDKQKFSLLTLIFISIFVIVLSNLNFKAIQFVKLGINEVIYRSSYIASIPENKLKDITFKFKSHINLYENYQKELIKVSKEKFCLSFFFKKADLTAITKSSLPVAIFPNIQIT